MKNTGIIAGLNVPEVSKGARSSCSYSRSSSARFRLVGPSCTRAGEPSSSETWLDAAVSWLLRPLKPCSFGCFLHPGCFHLSLPSADVASDPFTSGTQTFGFKLFAYFFLFRFRNGLCCNTSYLPPPPSSSHTNELWKWSPDVIRAMKYVTNCFKCAITSHTPVSVWNVWPQLWPCFHEIWCHIFSN